jgi:hypothetical protein
MKLKKPSWLQNSSQLPFLVEFLLNEDFYLFCQSQMALTLIDQIFYPKQKKVLYALFFFLIRGQLS